MVQGRSLGKNNLIARRLFGLSPDAEQIVDLSGLPWPGEFIPLFFHAQNEVSPMVDPVARVFATLRMEDFPVVIDFIKDGTTIHTITVTDPGVLSVPAIKADRVRIDFGNGRDIIERDMTK